MSNHKETSELSALVDDETHVTKRHKCDYPKCTYSADRTNHLKEHIDRIHLGVKKYHCPEGDFSAMTQSELTDHSWIHKASKRYTCEHCDPDKPFRTNHRNSLRRHIRSKHTGEKPYHCGMGNCFYAGVDSGKVKKHIKAIHLDLRPFPCECGKYSARTRYKLREHRRIHTGEKPYHCKYCPDSFGRLSTLKDHIRAKHTGEKPYVCDYSGCDYASSSMSNLYGHKRAIHLDLRPYVCNECKYNTSHSTNLVKHKRIHDGIRPYVCKIEGDAFTDSSGLARHIKYHLDERNYFCEECDKGFNTMDNLTQHLKRDSNQRDFVCDECSFSFITNGELERHLERKACWYTELSWKQWEMLCIDRIAPLLLASHDFETHPRVYTPDIEDHSWIKPEIMYENGDTTVIIDAKRTTYATGYKDLVIYPEFADTVEFWCLFGESKRFTDEGTEFIYRSSEELITMLDSLSNADRSVIDAVVVEIRTLQQPE